MCQSFYGGRCERCHEVVNTGQFAETTPCPSCGKEVLLSKIAGELKQCGRCLLIKPIIGVHRKYYQLGPICQTCWNWLDRPKVLCAHCQVVKIRSRKNGKYCEACRIMLASSKGECPECKQQKLLSQKDKFGRMVCSTCADRLADPVAACSHCLEVKRLNNAHPFLGDDLRVCSNCYKKLTTPKGPCARCSRIADLHHLWEGQRICSSCKHEIKKGKKPLTGRKDFFKYPAIGNCAECGEEKRLERNHPTKAGGICSGCRKRTQRSHGECGRCKMPRQLVVKNPNGQGLICEGCRLDIRDRRATCRRNI